MQIMRRQQSQQLFPFLSSEKVNIRWSEEEFTSRRGLFNEAHIRNKLRNTVIKNKDHSQVLTDEQIT